MNRPHTIEDEMTPTVILLDCGRTLTFTVSPPKTGEFIYCSYHTHYVRVRLGNAEYRVRCTQCRMSRGTGAARLDAEMRAVKHAQKTGHSVEIRRGSEIVHTLREKDAQLELSDVPPF